MTRKDYEMVARALAKTREEAEDAGGVIANITEAACNIADEFASDNPRFDRARFLAATYKSA